MYYYICVLCNICVLIMFQVRTFLDLQQKAAEVMAAVTIWESELNNVEMGLLKVNEHGGAFIKENVGPLYK